MESYHVTTKGRVFFSGTTTLFVESTTIDVEHRKRFSGISPFSGLVNWASPFGLAHTLRDRGVRFPEATHPGVTGSSVGLDARLGSSRAAFGGGSLWKRRTPPHFGSGVHGCGWGMNRRPLGLCLRLAISSNSTNRKPVQNRKRCCDGKSDEFGTSHPADQHKRKQNS